MINFKGCNLGFLLFNPCVIMVHPSRIAVHLMSGATEQPHRRIEPRAELRKLKRAGSRSERSVSFGHRKR